MSCESLLLRWAYYQRVQALRPHPLYSCTVTRRLFISDTEQVPQHGRLEGQFVVGKMTRQPAVIPGTRQLCLRPLTAKCCKNRFKNESRNRPVLRYSILPPPLLRISRQHAQLCGIWDRPLRIPAVEASYHGRIAPGAQHVQPAAIHQIPYSRHPGQLIPELLGIRTLLLRRALPSDTVQRCSQKGISLRIHHPMSTIPNLCPEETRGPKPKTLPGSGHGCQGIRPEPKGKTRDRLRTERHPVGIHDVALLVATPFAGLHLDRTGRMLR